MHPRVSPRALLSSLVVAGLGLTLLPASAAPVTGSPGSARSGDSLLPALGNGGYDVRDYDIDLTWRASQRRISATTRIRAVATQDLSAFNLELDGLRVRRIRVDGAPATFRRDGAELTVTPASAVADGARFTTTVRYDGRPRPQKSKQLGRTGWISTPDGATALSEPSGSETWYPVNNTLRDKATYSISVDVPKSLKAASNGRLVGRETSGRRTTWHWREDSPMAPYLTMVSIGKYRMFTRTLRDGLPLVSFVDVREGQHRKARRTLPEVLRFLSDRFGPYPFTSSGLVVDRIDVGYALETQGRPVLAGSAPDWLIMHEIAHQWFGNSVTPADWRHIWLNEGMATYTEWLWEGHRSPRKGAVQEIFDFYYGVYGKKARFWDLPPGDPGSADRLFARQIYDRGAMTMHALRLEVGSRDFFRILRRWTQQHRHGTVTTRDFIRLAEQVSGRQLDDLFQAWLYTPRKPRGY